jgi:CheY-like chemotaxis protein
MKILIVDDVATSRVALTAYLTRRGHHVTSARDGAEALSAFRQTRFEMIISDWIMPGLSGVDLCRQVRADPGGRHLFFILFTLLSGRARLHEGLEAGADDFISKPIDEAQLDATLQVAQRIVALRCA